MACLIYSDPSGRRIVFELTRDAAHIGRAGDNDVVSDDLRVSRHHAVVVREDEKYRIRDVGSSLGVQVNNKRVEDAELQDGDLIRLGDSLYTFVSSTPTAIPSIDAGGTSAAGVVGSALVSGVAEAARSLRTAFEGPAVDATRKDDPAPREALTRMEYSLDALRGKITRIERARRTLQTLYEIGKVLNSAVNRDNLLDLIMDLALRVLRAERGFLMLFKGDEENLVVSAARNMEEEIAGGDPGISTSIAKQVAISGQPVLTTDAMKDDRFSSHASIIQYKIRSVVCVPLVDKVGKPMGVIYVDSRSTELGFDEEDRDFLAAFANYAAIAIDNQRLFDEIAARARMEEELKAMRRLDEMKSELMSIVAHDVRTPLTSIISYAEILEDDFDSMDPRQRRTFLERIVREANRLDRLTSNYLDLAKIEAGEMTIKVEPFDPVALLRESFEAFEGQASVQKVELIFDGDGESCTLTADRDRLLQVLANLISNALKFTPESGRVTVSLEPAALPGERPGLQFQVADTGRGVPPEELDQLFRRFGQAGEAPQGRPRGTGLGLVVAREIVELHGGRIIVESSPGSGSRFSFIVPVSGPEQDASPPLS
jgi:signal transduction histidine kinase